MKTSHSIKWKVLTYFLGFSFVLIVLLWMMQVVFLEPIYKNIKIKSIKDTADEVAETLRKSGDIQSLSNWSKQNEFHIRVASSDGYIMTEAIGVANPLIVPISYSVLPTIYSIAETNGGSAFINNVQSPQITRAMGDYITYVKVIDSSAMVIIQALIVPVSATIEVIKVQLLVVTAILLLLAAVLTALISRRIAKPIIETNERAKNLRDGEYEKPFAGGGYKEVTELNETLEQARIELGKINELRNELLANVSHDLKTPLTMIAGYAEMMRDIPGENNTGNLDIIIDETVYLSNLVNDMLSLDSGRPIEKSWIKLDALIEHVKTRIKHVTDFDVMVEGVDEEVMINADGLKIQQVIYNLVLNAVNHSGSDRIIIKSEVLNNTLRISVIDEGKGIPVEELNHIWDRYYRSNNDHQRNRFGSGLGLSIVRNILRQHGYELGVKSEIGVGTEFWFDIRHEDYGI